MLEITKINDSLKIYKNYSTCISTYCCHRSKISNSVMGTDNCLPKAQQLSMSKTLLHIFDICQHYVSNLVHSLFTSISLTTLR